MQMTSTGMVAAFQSTQVRVIQDIPVTLLHPHPDNDQSRIEPGNDLEEMIQQIRVAGIILTPLLVTPLRDREGEYTILAGHRRWAAARVLGWATVPAAVEDNPRLSPAEIALIENQMRKDMSPVAVARRYQALVDLGWTQQQIAASQAKSQTHVSTRLALLRLPEALHPLVGDTITIDEANEALKRTPAPILERAAQIMTRGPGTSFQAALEEARREDNARVSEQKAQQWAASNKGAKYVPHAELAQAAPVRTQLHPEWQRKQIAAAREADTLVVTGATWGGEPEFYTTVARREVTKDETRSKRQAEEARWPFLVTLVRQSPSRDDWRRMATAYMLTPVKVDESARAILRRLAKDHGLPPVRDSWTGATHDGLSDQQATWVIGVVCAESIVRFNPQSTSPLATWYTTLLSTTGYTPDPTERSDS